MIFIPKGPNLTKIINFAKAIKKMKLANFPLDLSIKMFNLTVHINQGISAKIFGTIAIIFSFIPKRTCYKIIYNKV